MRKIIGVASTFIGTIIGAGFATGQEISLYFGKSSIFSIIIATLFFGIFCYVFLRIGSLYEGNAYSPFRKFSYVAKFLVKASNIVIFCATVAGSEIVFFNLFGIRGGRIITTVLVIIFSFGNTKKLSFINTLIVPIIIVLVITIFISDKNFCFNGKITVFSPFCYVAMNVTSGGFLTAKLSKKFTKSDCVKCAFLCTLIIFTLLFAIYCIVKNVNVEMPLLYKAKIYNLSLVGNVVLYLAIFTTLLGTMHTASNGNAIINLIVGICGLLVSTIGFEKIVNNFYPILGWAGGLITIYLCIHLIVKIKSLRYYNQLSQ